MEKMTNRKHFELLMSLEAVKAFPTTVQWIEHQIELLDKKNTAPRKVSAQQEVNKGLSLEIYQAMKPNVNYTISDINKTFSCCTDLTNQKVTSLVNALVKEGKVEREIIKGRSYFMRVGD